MGKYWIKLQTRPAGQYNIRVSLLLQKLGMTKTLIGWVISVQNIRKSVKYVASDI